MLTSTSATNPMAVFNCGLANLFMTWCASVKGSIFVASFPPLGLVFTTIFETVFLGEALHVAWKKLECSIRKSLVLSSWFGLFGIEVGRVLGSGLVPDGKSKDLLIMKQDEEWIEYQEVMEAVIEKSGLDKKIFYDLRGNQDRFGVPVVGGTFDFFHNYSINAGLGRTGNVNSVTLLILDMNLGPYDQESYFTREGPDMRS